MTKYITDCKIYIDHIAVINNRPRLAITFLLSHITHIHSILHHLNTCKRLCVF